MPFHKFEFYDILTISQLTQKSFISINSFNNDPNICLTQRKNFLSIPMKDKVYTSQKNFHTHQKIEFTQSCLHIKFSWFHTHWKSQVKIHPTMPKTTYNAKLHKSSTLSKQHNNSKMPQNQKISMTT